MGAFYLRGQEISTCVVQGPLTCGAKEPSTQGKLLLIRRGASHTGLIEFCIGQFGILGDFWYFLKKTGEVFFGYFVDILGLLDRTFCRLWHIYQC